MEPQLYIANEDSFAPRIWDFNTWDWVNLQGWQWNEGGTPGQDDYWRVFQTLGYGEIRLKDEWEADTYCSLIMKTSLDGTDVSSFANPSGKLSIMQAINDNNYFEVYSCIGPSPWQVIQPVKLFPGPLKLNLVYEPYSNNKNCSINDLQIYKSRKINCRIVDYKMPKSLSTVATANILRGFNIYQQMNKGGTECSFGVMFDNYVEYKEFLNLALKRSFLYVDKDGVCYRGLISPESFDGKMIGRIEEGYFYRDIKLLCAQELGVGW